VFDTDIAKYLPSYAV